MTKDFYAILGVQKSASEAEIKQAYRKLSRELHPDKHKGDKEKEAKFKEVNEAYEVLSDAKKKEAYDRFGSADFSGFRPGQGGGFGGFSGFDPSSFDGDFGDIFDAFFGGTRSGGKRSDTRGRTLEVEITIPFSEAVRGVEREISLKTEILCASCGGTGSAEGSKLVTCVECGGTGAVTRTSRSLFGMIRQSVICETCRGAGKVPEKPCNTCKGEGRTTGSKTVKVRIPAGIDDGQTLRVTGEGEAGKHGGTSGDLLVRINVESDKRFEREGDDIRSTVSLRVVDAVLGTKVDIETVHGTSTIDIPAGTQPGQVLRLKGKGMPIVNSSRMGDHFVTVDIVIPVKLSREEKRLFEELRQQLS
ncbi:MAG: molecular chaperone DnaJ [Candidatus Peribacteraceae bacterium]|nr:molecular chaperone DnaJ [Candidatus Peribacteraceae bacterium]